MRPSNLARGHDVLVVEMGGFCRTRRGDERCHEERVRFTVSEEPWAAFRTAVPSANRVSNRHTTNL